MALNASWINASSGSPSYDAATLRALDTILETPAGTDPLDSRQGVRPHAGNSLKVTNTGLTYSVAPGVAVISKKSQGAVGAYRVVNTATVTGSIPAADATYARRDVVVLKVQDTDVDGSGQRSVTVVYRAGTPAASPAYPAVNAGELLLAQVDLPANSTSPTITDARVFTVASGGVTPSNGGPPNPYPGQVYYDLAQSQMFVWTGSVWRSASPDFYTGTESVISGPVPPAGTPKMVRCGTYVGTTDANSAFVIPMSAGGGNFPNGLVGASVTPGDNQIVWVNLWQAYCSASGLEVVVRNSSGGGLGAGSNVRIDFVAYGW